MKTSGETPVCHLVYITKNRYKIVVLSGKFTSYHAEKIPGCYFSGNVESWVFPVSEKNRDIFESIIQHHKVEASGTAKTNLRAIIEIDKFRKYLENERYSESTVNTYVSFLTKFFDFFPNKSPDEIGMEEIEIYNYKFIIRKGLSGSFQNQFVSAIKKFYEKIHRNTIIIDNIERPRKEKRLPQVLSKEDVSLLLGGIGNLKHRAILSLIYSAGLRRSELLNLKLGDIDSKRMVINIRAAKGKKDRIVSLSPRILELLKDYYRKYRPNEYLFEGQYGGMYSAESVGRIFKRARARAGISTKGGVHILRHSFATHIHESGYDIRLIQEILGHMSSKTTEIYTHVSTKSIRNVISPFEDL